MIKTYGLHAFVEFEMDDKAVDPEYHLPSIKNEMNGAIREILSERFKKRSINKPMVMLEFKEDDA